uniref:Serine/threonine/tyrosine interacting-like 1 n=1 Tax=Hucho hucho TaxID=62062 RepID=A0A4W5LZW7_9TELE
MAGTTFCEVSELYNILNQNTPLSRLPEFNYLCLIDACAKGQYNASHIITLRCHLQDSKGKFIMPAGVEVESMRNIVVYDSNSSSLQGSAMECAEALTKSNRYPVQILKGGYQRFSALNPFIRTQKILYTIKELESLRPYTVELLPDQLYLGDYNALVNVSEDTSHVLEKGNLHVNVADSVAADLYSSFERICVFIGSHFVIFILTRSISEAWEHVLQCKTNMRPNRGFVQQLYDWELHTLGRRMTDIAVPCY